MSTDHYEQAIRDLKSSYGDSMNDGTALWRATCAQAQATLALVDAIRDLAPKTPEAGDDNSPSAPAPARLGATPRPVRQLRSQRRRPRRRGRALQRPRRQPAHHALLLLRVRGAVMTWQTAVLALATIAAMALAWAFRGDREDQEAAHTYGAGIAEEVTP